MSQEKFEIVWSHSRLNKIIENPKEYYLSYKQGIKPKMEKKSLYIGSAVHYGLEIGSSDLRSYFEENPLFNDTRDTVSVEEVMASSMVKAFLKIKPEFIEELLTDPETGEKAVIIQEEHELKLTCDVKSNKFSEYHKFLGIIDLLFYTNKGWILCDYKTSSGEPDWDIYKSQLFDYKMLLMKNFPEVPLYKIAIINLQKTKIKLKKSETQENFKKRIESEYECNPDLINWHIYEADEFSEESTNDYLENLTEVIDMARTIEDEKLYYLNHAATIGMYGKSQYWDIFYHTEGCHNLYKIKDTIFDPISEQMLDERDCLPIDMLTVEKGDKILNKFWQFKREADSIFSDPTISKNKQTIFDSIEQNYITDEALLEEYWLTYEKNI